MFSRTSVLAMLQQARVAMPESQVQIVLLKDSLEMTDADRKGIRVAAAPELRLLITHSPDTMVLTAAYLARARLGKTMVIIDAMVPSAVRQFGQPVQLRHGIRRSAVAACQGVCGEERPRVRMGASPQELRVGCVRDG